MEDSQDDVKAINIVVEKVVNTDNNTDNKLIEMGIICSNVVEPTTHTNTISKVVVPVVPVVPVVSVVPVVPVVPVPVSVPAEMIATSGLKLLGLEMISESSLTEDQKKLATTIYDSIKSSIQSFISDPSINNTIKITKIIGQLIKQLENVKVDGKEPSGADKKVVAIQLGRILIKEVTPDGNGEAAILMVYDVVAEPTLEAMIEVSKVVNIVVQAAATKCCPGIIRLIKSMVCSK